MDNPGKLRPIGEAKNTSRSVKPYHQKSAAYIELIKKVVHDKSAAIHDMASIKQEDIEDGWEAFIRNFENGPQLQMIGQNINFDYTESSLTTGQVITSATDPSAYHTSEPDDINMSLDFANQLLEPAEGIPSIDLSQRPSETQGSGHYSADHTGLTHRTNEVTAENVSYCTDQIDFGHQTCEVPVGDIPDSTGEASGMRTKDVSNEELGIKLDAIKAMYGYQQATPENRLTTKQARNKFKVNPINPQIGLS